LLTAPAVADVQTITHGKDLMVSCQQAIIALDTPQETPTSSAQNEAFLCMAYLSGVMATAQHANELAKLRYSQASNVVVINTASTCIVLTGSCLTKKSRALCWHSGGVHPAIYRDPHTSWSFTLYKRRSPAANTRS